MGQGNEEHRNLQLWVDALYINQSNVLEGNYQFRLLEENIVRQKMLLLG
jgi:chemotaxis methyl-accepting protein methylase